MFFFFRHWILCYWLQYFTMMYINCFVMHVSDAFLFLRILHYQVFSTILIYTKNVETLAII